MSKVPQELPDMQQTGSATIVADEDGNLPAGIREGELYTFEGTGHDGQKYETKVILGRPTVKSTDEKSGKAAAFLCPFVVVSEMDVLPTRAKLN